MEAIRVNVKLFGTLRSHLQDYDPCKGVNVALSEGNAICNLLDVLGLSRDETKLFIVKGLARKLTYELEDSDEVSIFLPVGGG
jgi:molybdopterin converting factor small subunit